jgi:hypothetical protein
MNKNDDGMMNVPLLIADDDVSKKQKFININVIVWNHTQKRGNMGQWVRMMCQQWGMANEGS